MPRAAHVALMALVLLRPHGVAAAGLTAQSVALSQRVPASRIVGRAICGGAVWLLNEEPQLIELSLSAGSVSIHQLRSLRKEEAPWGLACLADQTLWTLLTPRTLGRMNGDGLVLGRVDLQVPTIALFGAGTRLLLESLPLVPASAILTARAPRRPSEGRPWPGLLVRAAPEGAALLARNIVNCGLADHGVIPCWFPGMVEVSLSDGVHAERRVFARLRADGLNSSVPLRDVAMSSDRLWLLAAAAKDSDVRRGGSLLVLVNGAGGELGRLEAAAPFRMIVTATGRTCVLLDDGGTVIEVHQP